MLVPVSHADWQVLRAIGRTKGGAVGRTVRMVPSLRTKDGSFLTSLEKRGLLERAGAADRAAKGEYEGEPAPFAVVWRLTPLGETAAEYGEYENGRSGLSLPTPEEFARLKRKGDGAGASADGRRRQTAGRR